MYSGKGVQIFEYFLLLYFYSRSNLNSDFATLGVNLTLLMEQIVLLKRNINYCVFTPVFSLQKRSQHTGLSNAFLVVNLPRIKEYNVLWQNNMFKQI